MTLVEPEEEEERIPIAHCTIVYLGPVAPHWELRVHYGDQKLLDDFWTRVNARLLLLPKHDPQFRRNRERVNRDAERELIICDWDLGDDDAESTTTVSAPPVEQPPAEPEQPAEAEPAAEAEQPAEAEEPAEQLSSEDEPAAEAEAEQTADQGAAS